MRFIPDLDVSKAQKEKSSPKGKSLTNGDKNSAESTQDKEKKEKKVVSYSLEADLVADVKATAKKREMYYSSLVNMVLKDWLAENTK